MNNLSTIPQDPSSVMRFVDGADERELMSMVSSKNPYSFMALAKLQSIRDTKMKEQAGQPTPPPMSEQIPQQLAQLASGQQPMQQQPQQPMQQPMQPPQQQGIASIGGEATGAGGGMVSFTDGGGVRRFATPNDGKDVRHFQAAGEVTSSPMGRAFSGISNFLTGGEEAAAERERISKVNADIRDVREKITTLGGTLGLAQQTPDQKKEYDALVAQRENLASQLFPKKTSATSRVSSTVGEPEYQQFPNKITTAAPAAVVGAGNDAGLATLSGQAAGMAGDAQKQLAPQYKAQNTALENTIKVMTDAQKERDAASTPEKFAATQGTQEERDKLQADRLAKLEQTNPDPYKNTANNLASLAKELGKDKENAPYQAMLSAAFKLMGNRSPYFMTALGEEGAAGLADYNQIKNANKKQEMALMSAESSLAAAQDSRKRGMNSEANAYMKDFYDRKKDALNFEIESVKAKTLGAIQLAGKAEGKPQLEINQIKDTYNIRSDLLKHNLEVHKAGIEGAKLGMMAIPDEAKVALFLAKRPDLKDAINSEQDRNRYAKNLDVINKNPMLSSLTEEERIAMAINEVIKGRAAFPSSGPSNSGKLVTDASGKKVWQPQ